MKRHLLLATALAAGLGITGGTARAAGLDEIRNIVVIYAENRSFDNLYGHFPGAEGVEGLPASASAQVDRNGSPLATLPPIWGGLTAVGVTPAVTQGMTTDLANKPFAIDAADSFATSIAVPTRDLVHRFYQNQMQINGGRNDRFVAWGDNGALAMGLYDGAQLPMWKIARDYVLADRFFMAAFGGSFLNHQWLICACTPFYPNAATSPGKAQISVVEEDGVTLKTAANSPASAREGGPKWVNDGGLTPDFYAVNTMQPPYQPSASKPAAGGDARFADPAVPSTLPPQTATTIGDLLSAAHVSWAWYAGAWQAALDGKGNGATPNFQTHHQPFNYFAAYAPGTKAREEHLLDGGLNGAAFIAAIDQGKLPQVAFYKPQGNLNEHPGYADVLSGDQHLADVIAHLQASPQWSHMVVVVTYDENGGFWDHVAPPKADRWGPGTRIPAIIVSPFARRGVVDHTPYDTTSILRLITHRFSLPVLPGLTERDHAIAAHGGTPLGDLTNALTLTP
ncbi:acid phosphatase [Rhodovastum atsumiense]|uniref:Acid phosphatase n=1 Tax=Rhodovastum atsumiense TaxID=504468 RepID=A0A5M6IMY2_9PROT|nr:acid phosphatase [Rhodovastum atsumiense]KAA5608908.1 acid phosphatase [Rhodovastum atsumiense]